VDVNMDAKLTVELDVKLAIKKYENNDIKMGLK